MGLRLIKIIRGFSEGARLDWLHPSHGPFPDFAAIYENDEHRFEALAWETHSSWISAVCGPDRYHSGFPKSYRWFRGEGETVWCSPSKGKIYDAKICLDGKNSITNQVAVASVLVHIKTEPRP